MTIFSQSLKIIWVKYYPYWLKNFDNVFREPELGFKTGILSIAVLGAETEKLVKVLPS